MPLETDLSRRKIRKGTRSCWECKRRKTRCTFFNPSDEFCISCRRRGTVCVSQEYEEQPSRRVGKAPQVGDRIERVEALVAELLKQAGRAPELATPAQAVPNTPFGPLYSEGPGSSGPDLDAHLPTPDDSPSAHSVAAREDTSEISSPHMRPEAFQSPPHLATQTSANASLRLLAASTAGKYDEISKALHALLPSPEECRALVSDKGTLYKLFFQMKYLQPNQDMSREPLTVDEVATLPPPTAHPVVIARKILFLAIMIQMSIPYIKQTSLKCAEDWKLRMQRMVDVTNCLVTGNDDLVGCAEGLGCMMLEASFQANYGNLRRAWTLTRKAMVIAQLMGIHRGRHHSVRQLDPAEPFYPQYTWFRLVYMDRHLSLLLGLPQGSRDTTMTNAECLSFDPATSKLERLHCTIVSRILERNELDSPSTYYTLTQEIDEDLRKAAALMPTKYWLIPAFLSLSDPFEIFNEMMRLLTQALHYSLLAQLHLPYMLCPPSQRKYDYSKVTCANASRETLSRYATFRSFNQVACSCRIIDFISVMAAMTLLLAHLESHNSHLGNFLLHQRLGDRAMVQQTLERLEELNDLNSDHLSYRSAQVLRRLLDVEADAARGQDYRTESLCGHDPGAEDDAHVLKLDIPYFGTVKIAKQGLVFREGSEARQQQKQQQQQQQQQHPPVASASQPAISPQSLELEVPVQAGLQTPSLPQFGDGLQQELPSLIDGTLKQNLIYPGLTASADDWVFQGTDLAFFDNLMRGVTDGVEVDSGFGGVPGGQYTIDWGMPS